MPEARLPLWRRILQLRLLFVANVVVLVLLGLSFGREMVRNIGIQRDIDSLQQQADDLKARNLEITQLSEALQTQSYVEREARLKLGLKKPGEEVVIVKRDESKGLGGPVGLGGQENVDEAAADPMGLLTEPDAPKQVANPTKWWYYFFDSDQFNKFTAYGNER